MVLTLAVVDDILDDNQFFMILVKRDTEHIARIYFISTKNFFIHSGHTCRRFKQPFTCTIFSDQFQDLLYMILDLFPIVGYF
ncbi:hypothetical protein D3C74_410300 [compost metagenome]